MLNLKYKNKYDYYMLLNEKAKSKSQQRLMGMVYAYKKGKLDLDDLPSSLADKIKSISDGEKRKTGDKRRKTKGMNIGDVKDFAQTKHKGLPEKVKEHIITKFDSFINESKTITKEKLSKIHGIKEKDLDKIIKASLKFERKHTDNNEIAKNIVLKNLEKNIRFYHDKFGDQEMNNIIKQIEQEERQEKNKNME